MSNFNSRVNNSLKAKSPILPKHVHDEKNGLNYTLHGDYYYPDIDIQNPDSYFIGKWGRMHEKYLREHKTILYNQLVLQGNLSAYLIDLNEQAQTRLELIVQQLQRRECVDEKLKAQDQMLWVKKMNSILNRAEETVLVEMIFV